MDISNQWPAALTASYNGQRSLADQLASLEAQLKAARIAQAAESANCPRYSEEPRPRL